MKCGRPGRKRVKMSEPWVEGFKTALLRFVQQYRPEAVEVVGWDDSAEDPGGCPSCYSGLEYEVDIYFRTAKGKSGTYNYNGKFTYLLDELTS